MQRFDLRRSRPVQISSGQVLPRRHAAGSAHYRVEPRALWLNLMRMTAWVSLTLR